VSDAGKRCSDVVNLHRVAGKAGHWAAIRLSDGGSDGVAYENRPSAIVHQLHESQCAYIQVPEDHMPAEDADRFLELNRGFYEAGFRLTDPDDPRHLVTPNVVRSLGFVNPLIRRNPA
jgi:hypothetical protein